MTEERKIRGEPADEETKSVEAIIKREYERWMKPAEKPEERTVESAEDEETEE
jgi:hypothetical protein